MTSSQRAVTLAQLKAALSRPLPGLTAQIRMAPSSRPVSRFALDAELHCRQAAVLALFYPCAGDLCLVLTRRTDSLPDHSGQISLPGGSIEAGETAAEAALREAWEELAVDPTQVETLAPLSRLYVPPTNFCIQPVVGYIAGRPAFRPAPYEVAEVIEEPLTHLLDRDSCATEVWQLHGERVSVPFYRIGTHKVWGATAMILCELVGLLS